MTANPALQRQPVRWVRLIRRQGLWLPLVPLVFCLIFAAVARSQATRAALLARHGVDTVALVTGRETRVERDSDNNQTTVYYLSYTYDAGLGEVFVNRSRVDRALHDRTGVGDEIPLRYVFHQPDLHEIEPGDAQVVAWVFGLFAAVFGGLALGGGLLMARRSASLIRAARDGEVREARVSGHSPSGITVNNRRLSRADWRDAAGETGQTSAARTKRLPAVGSVIVVYVDPRSGRGWWEGDF